MRNVMLLEEEIAKEKAKEMYGEVISCTPHENYDRIESLNTRVHNTNMRVEDIAGRARDNLTRIDDLNHKLCEHQRRLDVANDQLRALQRFVTDMCGIAAISMVLICILVGYILFGGQHGCK